MKNSSRTSLLLETTDSKLMIEDRVPIAVMQEVLIRPLTIGHKLKQEITRWADLTTNLLELKLEEEADIWMTTDLLEEVPKVG